MPITNNIYQKRKGEIDGERDNERGNREEGNTQVPPYRVQCGEPVRAYARIRTVRWNIVDTVR